MSRFAPSFFLCAVLVSGVALADGGRVLYADGDVFALRKHEQVSLKKDSPVQVGDTLVTGANGKLQWMLDDNSLYALPPNSSASVDAFAMAPRKAARAGGGTLLLNLLKGGFRTVSGFVGKRRNDDYQVVTPVATMGIRGTEYTLLYCNSDCAARVAKAKAGTPVPPNGLYISVDRGIVTAQNEAGFYEFHAGQSGYIASARKLPQLLPRKPEVLVLLAGDVAFQFDPSLGNQGEAPGIDVDANVITPIGDGRVGVDVPPNQEPPVSPH